MSERVHALMQTVESAERKSPLDGTVSEAEVTQLSA